MTENELSKVIIGAAIEVHRELGGAGLLEDVYEEALCHELESRGIGVDRQVTVPIVYKGKRLRKPLTMDVLVDDKVVVETKAVETFNPIVGAQLLTYLRLTSKKRGLVINFGEQRVSNGIHRVVNDL